VIIADDLGRYPTSFDHLISLAETAGAAVVDLNGRLNFPNTHPLCLTGSSVLRESDLILALDVRDLYDNLVEIDRETGAHTTLISPKAQIVNIGLGDLGISKWAHDYQRLQEVDLEVVGDTRAILPTLVDDCRELVQGKGTLKLKLKARFERQQGRHEALRREWAEESGKNWNAKPMTTARLAHEVFEAIKNEDWVLTANTLNDWTRRLWSFTRPEQHPGKSLGTGTQLGLSLGVALAYRGSGKLVVDIQPDGDLMYDGGALWIAAHEGIPMLVVMYNNRGYYNDWGHQIRLAKTRGNPLERAAIGMELDHPAPNFAKLAQAFDWCVEGPIESGDEVGPALRRAIREIKENGRPALVDTVTQFR
jgi:thiamine pyrophosphate-dependent acetolactate synthase large subunit-like protein